MIAPGNLLHEDVITVLIKSRFMKKADLVSWCSISMVGRIAITKVTAKVLRETRPLLKELRTDLSTASIQSILVKTWALEEMMLPKQRDAVNTLVLNFYDPTANGWVPKGISNGVNVFMKQSGELAFAIGQAEYSNIQPIEFFAFQTVKSTERHRMYDDTFDGDKIAHESMSSKSRILHSWFKPIWPTTARDFSMCTGVRRLPDGSHVFFAVSIPHPEVPPVEPAYCRGALITCGYHIKALPRGPKGEFRARLSTLIQVDPGGTIPKFLINAQAASRPLQINGMMEAIRKLQSHLPSVPSLTRHGANLPAMEVTPELLASFISVERYTPPCWGKVKGTRGGSTQSASSNAAAMLPGDSEEKSVEPVISPANAASDTSLTKLISFDRISMWMFPAHSLYLKEMKGSLPLGRLVVKVVEARGLKSTDLNGLSDPYLVLSIGPAPDSVSNTLQKDRDLLTKKERERDFTITGFGKYPSTRYQTTCIKKSLNPKWDNENLVMQVHALAEFAYLRICLYDRDLMGDEVVAETAVPLGLLDPTRLGVKASTDKPRGIVEKMHAVVSSSNYSLWIPFCELGDCDAGSNLDVIRQQISSRKQDDSLPNKLISPASCGCLKLELEYQTSEWSSFWGHFQHTNEVNKLSLAIKAEAEASLAKPISAKATESFGVSDVVTSLSATDTATVTRSKSLSVVKKRPSFFSRKPSVVTSKESPEAIAVKQFQMNVARIVAWLRQVLRIFRVFDDIVHWRRPLQTLMLLLLLIAVAKHPRTAAICTPLAVVLFMLTRRTGSAQLSGGAATAVESDDEDVHPELRPLVKSPRLRRQSSVDDMEEILSGVASLIRHSASDSIWNRSSTSLLTPQSSRSLTSGLQDETPANSFLQVAAGNVVSFVLATHDVVYWKDAKDSYGFLLFLLALSAALSLVPVGQILMASGVVYFMRKTVPVQYVWSYLWALWFAYRAHADRRAAGVACRLVRKEEEEKLID